MLGDLTASCLSLRHLIQRVCLLGLVCIHFDVCGCVCSLIRGCALAPVCMHLFTLVCARILVGATPSHSCALNPFAGANVHISGDQGTPLGLLPQVMATLCFESGSLRGSLITLGWLASEPRNPFIQYPALGLQAHTTMFNFLLWVKRMGSSSHLM